MDQNKQPLGVKWRKESRPCDQWSPWPDSPGYGIDCGKAGLVVLDEDEPQAIERALGYLPDTFTVQTGKGRHFYFRAGVSLVRNRVRAWEGVDIRADGGYVVGPGSTHSSGAKYEVINDRGLADLPRELTEKLTPGTSTQQPQRFELPDRIPTGQRNDTLFRYACSLVGRGVRQDEAMVLLSDAFGRCDEPLADVTPEQMLLRAEFSYGGDDGRFEAEVEREAHRMRVRREAQQLLSDEQAQQTSLPELLPLSQFLAVPDDTPQYRIQGLWPSDGRVLLAAQHKAGKTTMVGNLIRSLVDGDALLDHFLVGQASRVVLLDNESSPQQIRRWLASQGVESAAAVEVMTMRGRLSTFDLLSPETRSRWAQLLGTADVLIFDCLRPVLDALGLSEDKDAGRFLEALDELVQEAGIRELVVVHHMGHSNERSRGDSRILDWPDAVWKLVREDSDDPSSARFFSAYGRDVEQSEVRLGFDPDTRHLSVAGGSRAETKLSSVLDQVLNFVSDNPDCSQTAIERGVTGDRMQVRRAIHQLASEGLITITKVGQKSQHALAEEAS